MPKKFSYKASILLILDRLLGYAVQFNEGKQAAAAGGAGVAPAHQGVGGGDRTHLPRRRR